MSVVATYFASGSSNNSHGTGAFTTSSFSPSAGDLLYIVCGISDNNVGDVAANLTIADNLGAGALTYTPAATIGQVIGGGGSQQRAWTAPCPAGGAMTLTFDCGTADIYIYKWTVYRITGANNASPVGATATGVGGNGGNDSFVGAKSITLNAAPASTSVVIASVHANASGVTATIDCVTPGTGWSEDNEVKSSTIDDYMQTQQRGSSTSTTVAWNNVEADATPNTFSGSMLAVEIKISAGLGGAFGTVAETDSAGAWGAPAGVGYVKEVGTVANTTAGTTSAITVAAGGVPVGHHIVIRGSCDNTGSAGAATTISAADNSSQAGTANSYTLQTPQAIADPGAASAGQQGFALVCRVTRALLAGDVITITFGNSTAAKAIRADEYQGVNTATPVLAGTYTTQDNQTGQAVSISATPTKSRQMVIVATAVEGGTADTFTEDADTTNGAWVTRGRIGAGTTTSGATLNSADKPVSASGAQSYGTATMLGTARDHASLIFVLDFQSITAAFGTISETDSAGAWGRVHTRAWGVASESDTAGTMSEPGLISAPFNTVVETDTAGSWGDRKPFGLAAESDSAGAWQRIHTRAWGLAVETDSAAQWAIKLGLNAASESDSAGAWQLFVPGLFATAISGRKIIDQNGDVYPLFTMSSWALASNLSDADITTALEGVAANGFPGVTVWAGGGYDIGVGWHRYTNQAGDNFWTGTPWRSSFGPAWSSVDHVVDECLRLGLTLTLSLCGGNGTTGARPDWESASNAQMKQVGIDIATRYPVADYPHIVWHVMIDDSHTPATTAGARIEAYFEGINSVEGSARPVRWMENNNGGTLASNTTNDQGWLGTTQAQFSVNCMYTYSLSSVVWVEDVYAEVTTVPVGDCEPRYVGNSISQQDLRERTYAVFIEGGCIINFGHEDWWPFGAAQFFTDGETWDTVQTDDEVIDAAWAVTFIKSHCATADFAPSAFLTGGVGSGDTKAASGSSSTRGVAYFPNSRGSITCDTTLLAGTGSVRLRWYDPTKDPALSGSYTLISAGEAQNASRAVTHPGNNGDGSGDWLLLVELLETSAPFGTASETDSAGSWGRRHTRAWGTSAETDSAGAWGRVHTKSFGASSETDTAGAWGRVAHTKSFATAVENDTAGAWGAVAHTKTWGTAIESDSAGAWVATHARGWGFADEIDSAGAWGRLAHTKAWGLAGEADEAGGWAHGNVRPFGAASETDSAGSWAKTKTKQLGPVVEIDSAGNWQRAKTHAWGSTLEVDSAGVWAGLHENTWGVVLEVDTSGVWVRQPKFGIAVEIDSAGAWAASGGAQTTFTGPRTIRALDQRRSIRALDARRSIRAVR